MCFSASASFGASAVLLTIGVVAQKKSTTVSQRLFSCIPLFFCIQQFAEGVLWLGFSYEGWSVFRQAAMYTFLIFAQAVWPVMIPLSIMLLEKQRKRKRILAVFLGSGIVASLTLLYCIIFYKVNASIECYHINYRVDIPDLPMRYGGVFYLIPVIISPFISSIKRMWLLGVIIVVSYIITQIFYQEYLTSVWCFFAALISLIILNVVIRLNKAN